MIVKILNVNNELVDQIEVEKTPEVVRVIEWFNRVTLFDDCGYFKIIDTEE